MSDQEMQGYKARNKNVWFWRDDLRRIDYGNIHQLLNLDYVTKERIKPIANIGAYGGYFINLPSERLFDTKELCQKDLRHQKIKVLLQ